SREPFRRSHHTPPQGLSKFRALPRDVDRESGGQDKQIRGNDSTLNPDNEGTQAGLKALRRPWQYKDGLENVPADDQSNKYMRRRAAD
ncbi:hypothetical protein, partial [Nocardioides maradonensis]